MLQHPADAFSVRVCEIFALDAPVAVHTHIPPGDMMQRRSIDTRINVRYPLCVPYVDRSFHLWKLSSGNDVAHALREFCPSRSPTDHLVGILVMQPILDLLISKHWTELVLLGRWLRGPVKSLFEGWPDSEWLSARHTLHVFHQDVAFSSEACVSLADDVRRCLVHYS